MGLGFPMGLCLPMGLGVPIGLCLPMGLGVPMGLCLPMGLGALWGSIMGCPPAPPEDEEWDSISRVAAACSGVLEALAREGEKGGGPGGSQEGGEPWVGVSPPPPFCSIHK